MTTLKAPSQTAPRGATMFTQTEAKRRLAAGVREAKRRLGLPTNAPTDVQWRWHPVVSNDPTGGDWWAEGDDLYDWHGPVSKLYRGGAPGSVYRAQGAVIRVAIYETLDVSTGDRELVDVAEVWLGSWRYAPRVRLGLSNPVKVDGFGSLAE